MCTRAVMLGTRAIQEVEMGRRGLCLPVMRSRAGKLPGGTIDHLPFLAILPIEHDTHIRIQTLSQMRVLIMAGRWKSKKRDPQVLWVRRLRSFIATILVPRAIDRIRSWNTIRMVLLNH